MKWFVGLGNPGNKYSDTRHNVGFMALDRFARKWGIDFKESRFKGELGEGIVHGVKTVLIKPQTFMNLSGESLRAYRDYMKADIADLIVVYDDMDTEVGCIRLRKQGGPGGHNGIKSIIQHLGTEQFDRIRIGISRPSPGVAMPDYVLSPFARSEQARISGALDLAANALEAALTEPFDKVMAQFNKKSV
ncbi:MAG TPA: aminoacyl-tRNA hydrolase [Bacilli bacterium]